MATELYLTVEFRRPVGEETIFLPGGFVIDTLFEFHHSIYGTFLVSNGKRVFVFCETKYKDFWIGNVRLETIFALQHKRRTENVITK